MGDNRLEGDAVERDFIYLDYNATTPVDPRVAAAMGTYLHEGWGNPSSLHHEGRVAREAVEWGRARVAECLGCRPGEIVFTSGGSESINLAIRGVVHAAGGGHVITSAVEHPAVLEVVRALEREGRGYLSRSMCLGWFMVLFHNGLRR